MIVWSDLEKDALAEFLNIGMGTAAASLSSMLGQEILLSVPEISFVSPDELKNWCREEIGEKIVGVRQAFKGKAAGNIALLFTKDSGHDLVREFVPSDMPLEDLPDIQNDAISEIGNIVLNACMAAIADALHFEIPTELPQVVSDVSMIVCQEVV